MLSGKKKNNEIDDRLDEEKMVKAHKHAYDDGEKDSNTVGAAAAMEAMKKFSGGGGKEKQSQSDMIGLTMSEAAKLMGGKPAAEKQSAVSTAAELALKMYMKGGKDSSAGGSGGAGNLLSLASNFLGK